MKNIITNIIILIISFIGALLYFELLGVFNPNDIIIVSIIVSILVLIILKFEK